MAKKKYDYRAAQAHKRNQQKIADAKAKQREKEFIQQHGLKILIGVVAVIVAIWLIGLAVDALDGSIGVKNGALVNVEQDWIVSNVGTNNKPQYYKFGEYQAPEGYTLDADYAGSTDPLNQTMYYNADDAAAPVSAVYVSGVKGMSAEAQLNTILGFYTDNTGAKQGKIGGHDAHYAYIVMDTTVDEMDENGNVIPTAEENRLGSSFLVVYVDTIKDSSVLVMLNTAEGPLADVVAEDVLLAEAEKFMPLLSVEK